MSAVIDASAAIDLALGHAASPDHLDEVDLYAPYLIDLEFTQAIRALTRRGMISEWGGSEAVTTWGRSLVTRCAHAPLLERAWQLKANVTAYDASYIALAEQLRLPLLTSDRRLAATAREYCEVTLV